MKRLLTSAGVSVLIVIFSYNISIASNPIKTISIPSLGNKIELQHFYIASVKDKRVDQTRIGYITTAFNNYKSVNYELPLSDALMQYIHYNVKQDPNNEHFTLYIYDYFLYEKTSFKGTEIAIKTHFALYNTQGERIFDDYLDDTKSTSIDMLGFATKLLKNNIVDYLKSTDIKMIGINKAYQDNAPLMVQCSYVEHPDNKSFVLFSQNSLITSQDFSKRNAVKNASNQYFQSESGLGVSYQVIFENNSIQVNLYLLPYVDLDHTWICNNNIATNVQMANIYFKLSYYIAQKLKYDIDGKYIPFKSLKGTIDSMISHYSNELKDVQTRYLAEMKALDNEALIDKWVAIVNSEDD